MAYDEEEYLLLSGIQHFIFCRRQWALIHIEDQWEENVRTVEGELMHKNVDDPFFTEKRGGILTVRSMRIVSHTLGVTGVCDVVELIEAEDGVPLTGREGTYRVRPVEYKHGEPKPHEADLLQLAAQAMCLEEMLCCTIPEGMIFYGGTRRRQSVEITEELREKVRGTVREMQQLFQRHYAPRVKPTKSCRAYSLQDLCLPKLMRAADVTAYLERSLKDDST